MGASKSDDESAAELFSEIYRVVRRIPRGKVATYGQVAELAGLPGGARIVGRAMKLSAPARVPWQRVVGKKSRDAAKVNILDPVGGSVQRLLLEAEGVKFSDAGSISLARHGWLDGSRKTKRRGPRKAAPRRRKR